MSDRRLVLVHAHPDDECISTGGIIAKYSDEGASVCLVCCTNGEEGEVAEVPELGTVAEVQARLGEVRIAELREACRHLGRVDLRLLGYRDSGMDGTPANDDPRAFVNRPVGEAGAEVARILREVRPQVIVTYNEVGMYGHPDHIRAHEAALRGVIAAADPSFEPDSGPAHRVAKVYYTAMPKSWLRAAMELGRRIGRQLGRGEDDVLVSEEEIERIGTDDEAVTTAVDVVAVVDRKFDALAAHRTQYGTTQWFFEIPREFRPLAMGTEYFVLARSEVGMPSEGEKDLFERT